MRKAESVDTVASARADDLGPYEDLPTSVQAEARRRFAAR
jgi:hypothetical protein